MSFRSSHKQADSVAYLATIATNFMNHALGCKPVSKLPNPYERATEECVPLFHFISNILSGASQAPAPLFHGLFLISKMKELYPEATCVFGHRPFILSYMLGTKFHSDSDFRQRDWVKLAKGLMSVSELALMEREILHFLNYDVFVHPDDLADFTRRVQKQYGPGSTRPVERFASPGKSRSSSRTAPPPVVLSSTLSNQKPSRLLFSSISSREPDVRKSHRPETERRAAQSGSGHASSTYW